LAEGGHLSHLLAGCSNKCPVDLVVELFAPDLSVCELFDSRALLCGDRPLPSEPLINQPLRNAELFGECGLADLVFGEVVGEVHDEILAPLVTMSRASLVENSNSIATLLSMNASKHPEDQQTAEARRLAALFRERNEEGLSQEEFGARYNIGTQGMMWQLLNGKRPLNLKSAVGFAKGLKVPLEQISESIAAEVKDAAKYTADIAAIDAKGNMVIMELKHHAEYDADLPPYVSDAMMAIQKAYHDDVPREVFDAVRVLFSQLKSSDSGKLTPLKKDEAVKSSPAMQSIKEQAERAQKDAESHLATRTEEKRAARRVGEKRSKNIRH
jgi:transcriptional regulator with XRE-family HTH domain